MKCSHFGPSVHAMFGWVSLHHQEPTQHAQNESVAHPRNTPISAVDAQERLSKDNVSVPRKLIELQVEVFKSLKRACDQQRHILQEFGLTDFEPLDPESSIEQERIEEADIPSEVQVSKFKFKFPRARTFELFRARSRLYRSQILQVNPFFE